MAAELGQTTDPKALIPGESGAITGDLRTASSNMRTMDGVSGDLSKIDPAQWTGQASNEFRGAFGKEPPKWIHAMQRLSNGGQSLAGYGETLTWGQGEAQRAIEAYTKAQAAGRLAAAKHHAKAQEAIAEGTPPGKVPPFKDPSTGAAHEAQQILAGARKKVGEAAGQAATQLAGFTDDDGNSTYKGDVKDLEKKFGSAEDGSRYHRGGNAGYSRQDSGGKFLSDYVGITGPEKTLAETPDKWKVSVAEGKTGGQFGNGTAGGSGKAEGSVLGAGVEGKLSAGPAGVTAAGSADAYLAKGKAQGELHAGPGKVQGKGEAEIGAKADGKVHLGPTGGEAGGEAFAGAKAKGEANASVGGVGAGAHGEAWAGAGAEAKAKLGMGEDGKFHVGGSAGAALGVGGKVGFDVTVDPKEVTDTVTDAAHDAGHAAGAAGHAAGEGAKSVANGAKSAADGAKSLIGL